MDATPSPPSLNEYCPITGTPFSLDELQLVIRDRDSVVSDIEQTLIKYLARVESGQIDNPAVQQALEYFRLRIETLVICMLNEKSGAGLYMNSERTNRMDNLPEEVPMQLVAGITEGSTAGDILRAACDRLTAEPQNAIAYIQQYISAEWPENVDVLPSVEKISNLRLNDNARFAINVKVRTLLDPRNHPRSECIDRASETYNDICAIAAETTNAIGLYYKEPHPWKIAILERRPNPLGRLHTLVQQSNLPDNVSTGLRPTGYEWTEVRNEIYPYDTDRLDFAIEYVADIRHWAETYAADHAYVHISLYLEQSSEQDVIVKIYTGERKPSS